MSENEVKFMEYFRNTMLPNRSSISTEMVRYASSLIGMTFNASCNVCLHNSAVELYNVYNRMQPNYENYLSSLTANLPEPKKSNKKNVS